MHYGSVPPFVVGASFISRAAVPTNSPRDSQCNRVSSAEFVHICTAATPEGEQRTRAQRRSWQGNALQSLILRTSELFVIYPLQRVTRRYCFVRHLGGKRKLLAVN